MASNKDDRDTFIPVSPSAFAELMALERVEASKNLDSASPPNAEKVDTFRSLAASYPPGHGVSAFGGHVYAQAAYAASKTVERGFLIHEMTGTFIRPGRVDVPYFYTVRHLRDGTVYLVRAVDVRQNGKLCFSCLCCFKRDEGKSNFAHQPSPAQTRFGSILEGKNPEDHPVSPCVDIDWWIEEVRQGNIKEREFPGLDVRKVDMTAYNQTDEVRQNPHTYRQLAYYRLKGSPADPCYSDADEIRTREASGEYDNLYACAHMYSSDKNSLLLVPRALGIERWESMASLTLTVIFHQHGDALRMIDWDAAPTKEGDKLPKKWFIQEGWTPRSGENRCVHESWLWSPDGTLLATTIQDGMLRLFNPDRQEKL